MFWIRPASKSSATGHVPTLGHSPRGEVTTTSRKIQSGCAARARRTVARRTQSGTMKTKIHNPFPPHSMETENDNNDCACDRPTVEDVSGREAVPESRDVRTQKTVLNAGTISRDAHFRRLEAARRLPGACRRCGRPNPSYLKTCQRCRDYQRAYKLNQRNHRLAVPAEVAKILAQFRRELSHLRATVKTMANERRRAYRAGYQAGQAGRRARFRERIWMPPTMSQQELSTINHAYEHRT